MNKTKWKQPLNEITTYQSNISCFLGTIIILQLNTKNEMITFDRVKLDTKAEYFTITNENLGEWRYNKRTNVKTFIYDQKQPYKLFIQITPDLNKAIIEFTGKILLDDYPKLISIDTINQCLRNVNNLGFCQLQINKIISDSELISCDPTKDIEIEFHNSIKNIMISQLSNLNKFHVRKFSTTGYTVSNEVTTKNRQLRLSIYNKYKEILKAKNSGFLDLLDDPNALMNDFKNKYRIEANIKTMKQIRDYFGTTSNSFSDILKSNRNPLVEIFDVIFECNIDNEPNISQKRTLYDYESFNEMVDALVLNACGDDLSQVKKLLDNYYSVNTNKRKLIAPYRKLSKTSLPQTQNKFIIGEIRNKLIA